VQLFLCSKITNRRFVIVACFVALAEPSEFAGETFKTRRALFSTSAFRDCRAESPRN
jgi:hypothetical protein